MTLGKKIITQICVVVKDVKQVNANWAKVLGVEEERILTIFPDGILHYTNGEEAVYKDCQVAIYKLDNIKLELIQPGENSSPWRTFLEEHGQGVFHFCISVEDRKIFHKTLNDIGVEIPYHIGYHPRGSYSYVDSKEQLGLELSINSMEDNGDLIEKLLANLVEPFDELK